jgi:hypothetical protein
MCKDGTIPFEFSRDIVMLAILDDGTGRVVNDDLRFTVTILDPCLYDIVSFQETLSTINYAVSSSSFVYSPAGVPVYQQTYSLCPMTCELTMEGGAPIAQSLADGLGLTLELTPQPVFSMVTTDKSWSGFTARFSVACISLNSDVDPDTPGL